MCLTIVFFTSVREREEQKNIIKRSHMYPFFDRIQKQNVGTLGIHAKHTQNSPHELIGAKLPSCFQSVFSSGGLHICRLSCRAAGLSANRTAPICVIYVSKSLYFNLKKHKRHCPVVSAGVVICLKEREHYCTT